MGRKEKIIRDISWLSFNARVLQEARDPSVPLRERVRFLGIYSNNMDEFFRVRVATLKRMSEISLKARARLDFNPQSVLNDIQAKVLMMQQEFEIAWREILRALRKERIHMLDEKKLNRRQQRFVMDYFNEQVRSHIVPLMIESMPNFPALNDKALYLACKLSRYDKAIPDKFAIVTVPARHLPRFLELPSAGKDRYIILLEDVIRFAILNIFSFFRYDQCTSHIIKLTRDAEIDIDNDMTTSLMQKIEKGIKNRKKAKPVRFIYDKDIDPGILTYLIKKLGLSKRDNMIAGGRIHNFKDFMDFPDIIQEKSRRKKPFIHPRLSHSPSVSREILKRDMMLHFPYHSFDSVIDLIREAAIDPQVDSIKITAYRLAPRSKIVNALINALRNGKKVIVMLELRARFDEEANLLWKKELEEEGAKVLIGIPGMKVHAKICVIRKKTEHRIIHYGFVATGNLNEKTAMIYGDHCLLTADPEIMADANRIFDFLEYPKAPGEWNPSIRSLLVSPLQMRSGIIDLINREIRNAKKKKPAIIMLKLNSLSDMQLIGKLHEAALAGVEIRLIIRGICCMLTENNKFKVPIQAISIVDEYLEHSRVLIFHNGGKEKVFISSADWMIRNLDHRIEAAVPIKDKSLAEELKHILEIQLADNVKARTLDNKQLNHYVNARNKAKIRSQEAIYQYLLKQGRKS